MAQLKILPGSYLPVGSLVYYVEKTFVCNAKSQRVKFTISDVNSVSREPVKIKTSSFGPPWLYGIGIGYMITQIFELIGLLSKKYKMKLGVRGGNLLYLEVDMDTYIDIRSTFMDDAIDVEANDRSIVRKKTCGI